jgi:sulfide dehydrogenase [flavocytochrome c] flavoprotein chain
MNTLTRRDILTYSVASSIAAPLATLGQARQHVVIVGAGFGGATAAKYLRRFNPALRITVIEPSSEFVMCPMSNRVIAGGMGLRDISTPYSSYMKRYGLEWIKGAATSIDPVRLEVTVGKERIAADYLIVSPGVDYLYAGITGLESEQSQGDVLHAWKAGAQTQRLRDQLQAMPEGGVFAMHIPKVPYRCPPGPYERATLVANFIKTRKPKAKLLVFDSNPEIQAKKGLFEQVWKSQYAGFMEYVPNAEIDKVDLASKRLEFKVHGVQKADIINFIPPQRAGSIARQAGLANVGSRWCGVDFLNYESTAHKRVYVLGDSIASAAGLPKSGHMANQQGKVCAAAIAAQTLGREALAEPIIANTCYSFISASEAIHVAGVYRYDGAKKTMVPVQGAGGLSTAPSVQEGVYAIAWATNIIEDTLG